MTDGRTRSRVDRHTRHASCCSPKHATGNLDLTTGEEIIALLKRLSQERGVTVISATHDFKMLNVSDQVVWIRDGRVDKIEDREELSISIGQIGSRE